MFRAAVLNIVKMIRVDEKATATSFLFRYNERCFLITAKHAVEDGFGKLELFDEREWKDITTDASQAVIPGRNDIDIAALLVPDVEILEQASEFLTYDEGDIVLGADAYFVGFPYGRNFGFHITFEDQPVELMVPLVKKAIISGSVEGHD